MLRSSRETEAMNCPHWHDTESLVCIVFADILEGASSVEVSESLSLSSPDVIQSEKIVCQCTGVTHSFTMNAPLNPYSSNIVRTVNLVKSTIDD